MSRKNKKKQSEEKTMISNNNDDFAILYTLLGGLILAVLVTGLFFVACYMGWDKPEQPKPEPWYQYKPIPVEIPSDEGLSPEEYEELIERNPIQSNMSDYRTI